MYTKKALSTCFLAVVLLLFSCDRDVDRLSIVRSDEGTISISVRAGDFELRSGSDPMTVINNFVMGFFDDRGILTQVRELEVDKTSERDAVGGYRLRVNLPKGNYKAVLGANISESLRSYFVQGRPLSDFMEGVVDLSISDLLGGVNGQTQGVPMFLDQGPVTIKESDFEENSPAISVRLEPLLARVLVYGRPVFEGGFTSSGSKIGYFVSNAERALYLHRKMSYLSDGSTQEQAQDGSSIAHRYAASVSYDRSFLGLGGERKDYLYITNLYPQVHLSAAETYEATNLSLCNLYVRDLTVRPQDIEEGAIPHLTVSLVYVPSVLADLSPTASDLTYVSFRGHYMSLARFRTYVSDVLSGKSISVSGLGDAIKASGLKVVDLDKPKGMDVAGIKLYAGGVNYYSIPIRHFGDVLAPRLTSYGRYGVVRNNEYRLRLHRVGSLGSPVVPDLSVRQEALRESAPIQGGITINPTTIREAEITL